jgi:aminoglycoside 6'-N-acetyltransferase
VIGRTPQDVEFRPLTDGDFPALTTWLAKPHVRKFYQKAPVTLRDVALEYGPCVRSEEPTICHLAVSGATPFAYLQCYRNADYPEWAEITGASGGISVDLYIGETAYLRRGFGQAALSGFLRRVAFPNFRAERRAYITHEPGNTAALQCSMVVGFRRLRAFSENGVETILLAVDLASLK